MEDRQPPTGADQPNGPEALGMVDAAVIRDTLDSHDKTEPAALDDDQLYEFEQLYHSLLTYANEQLDVIEGIDSVEEVASMDDEPLLGLRRAFFFGPNAEEIIDSYVADNPDDLNPDQLETVNGWTASREGPFAVMEHREADSVLLDFQAGDAFAVKGTYIPLEAGIFGDLSVVIDGALLLPYDDAIVSDAWMVTTPFVRPLEDFSEYDVNAVWDEVRDRRGVAESLPIE